MRNTPFLASPGGSRRSSIASLIDGFECGSPEPVETGEKCRLLDSGLTPGGEDMSGDG